MKYVFINLKNFAVKNVLIFILFIVCAVTDVLIILFSHGAFQNFKASKDFEKQKKYVFNYTFSFGDIIDTQEDSDGRILSYFGTDSITPVQLREVLDKLDDNSKASMPGMYFSLMFDQDELKIDECFDVVRYAFPFGGSVQLQLGMTGGVCVRLIEVPFDKDVQSAGTII